MSLFISDAMAQTAPAGAPQGGDWGSIIMLVLFAAVFYFLILRPQNKRMKEHKSLMESLAKGDEVLTNGGLVGRITKISADNDFVMVALNDNNEVMVQKALIAAVLPKGTLKSLA